MIACRAGLVSAASSSTTTTVVLMMHSDQEEEDCSICNESLPKLDMKFVRMSCCGMGGLHQQCYEDINATSLSDKQKNQCIMCRTKKSKRGSEESIEQIQRFVEQGKAWAQSGLGDRYREGVGIDQSYQQAIELYELAASQGSVAAQYNLGLMYKRGLGVDQSYERAVEYFEAAARQEYVTAQATLGALWCRAIL